MVLSPTSLHLPDLLSLCPPNLIGHKNPHDTAAAESSAWVASFGTLTDKQLEFLLLSNLGELSSRASPYAPCAQFRVCCDLLNVVFAFDALSDQSTRAAQESGDVLLSVLRDPAWDDGSSLARMMREFLARLLQFASEGPVRRFLQHFEEYVRAVVSEAALRSEGRVLDVPSFTALRRENSGIRVCIALSECVLGVDLPAAVLADPTFTSVYWAAVDMVWLANDVYSYAMEARMGLAGNNFLTVLMAEGGMDVQASANYAGVYFAELMATFVERRAHLESRGSLVDANVVRCIDAMGHWVVGSVEWSLESERYFGRDAAEVKRTLVVQLRPGDEMAKL
ncbi:hypothetical protein PLICRDRAFT_119075 [Plicaturopsis crispa FD-325 SS-3]|uniref:Terpene synthase n=1 Tax=Plicaturopsis crispa FD-325 SS-3 TaxID=944288 RepID=A0A0C9SKH3_PLICR|nr:hypothetical protein PLICRDRAFT_119075 [Plicaturopsis crispa FD-325 SS-3]